MKRRAILYSADCEEKRFDGYYFRNQLPFVPELPLSGEKDDAHTRRRAEYSLQDAFLLRLMMEFVDHGGVAIDAAQYSAGNAFHHLALASERVGRDHDVWLVFIQNRPGELDFAPRALCAGCLDEIPALIRDKSDPSDPPRVVLVNASGASRFVLNRADEFGILREGEARPVWLIEETR
ncbi:hypothetical protein PE067_08750 [Paracoccus sp. DMF-8]|uniref:hypothetical protein n=1 Tax=Paracoccus sp. DMF-8 TaxID=3019445 RepID=UPI0023E88C23|nr:hypothetical protein [Paracoccus sp. DMF-8]MDF3606212.1 hypothetical protein [Paracoccus sp. DMF-8]